MSVLHVTYYIRYCQSNPATDKSNTVFDLISEHTLISGQPDTPIFLYILIISSSDFREGNTNLLWPDGHNGEDYCQST